MAAPIPFDDRDGAIWLDGALVPWRDARIHLLSHGLHYASSVFEGMRAYGGHVFRHRDHSERFFNSARLLGFAMPFDIDAIERAVDDVLRANELRDCYIRPIAWRGPEQLSVSAHATKIHVAVAAWSWPNLFGADRMAGIAIGISRWRRPHPDTYPIRAKAAGGYMIGTIAKHAAEADGFSDALMLDLDGNLAELTGANIFLVFDGALHTPTTTCSLDGITRRTVIALARRRGIGVVERTIRPEELAAASEVFVTGTAAELTPVARIDDFEWRTGPITTALHADYEALVQLSPADADARLAA